MRKNWFNLSILILIILYLSSCNAGSQNGLGNNNKNQTKPKRPNRRATTLYNNTAVSNYKSILWSAIAGKNNLEGLEVTCVPIGAELSIESKDSNNTIILHPTLQTGSSDVKPGNCAGYIIFNYEANVTVLAANVINGQPCTTNNYYASCLINLGLYQSAIINTNLSVGPYQRESSSTQVSSIGEFAFDPFTIPITIGTEGSISISQNPVVILANGHPITTNLIISNTGPSGAKNTIITERFPEYIDVAPSVDYCTFENQLLTCTYGNLDPNGTVTIPIGISAASGYPTSQLITNIQASSDIGNASTKGTINVTGNVVYGEATIDVNEASLGEEINNNISLKTLLQTLDGGPSPGIPARWSVTYTSGLEVISVTPSITSTQILCSNTKNSVSCVAPNFGSGQQGTDANADILLRTTQNGTQTATMTWDSTQGSGNTSASVRVLPEK
jgi:hypothetical protein